VAKPVGNDGHLLELGSAADRLLEESCATIPYKTTTDTPVSRTGVSRSNRDRARGNLEDAVGVADRLAERRPARLNAGRRFAFTTTTRPRTVRDRGDARRGGLLKQVILEARPVPDVMLERPSAPTDSRPVGLTLRGSMPRGACA
jgi:hypothetical protein